MKCRHCGEFLLERPSQQKWYFKNSSLIALFLFVGPFALPLVWTNPRYSRIQKWVITAVMLVITYFLTIAMAKSVQSILNYYNQINLSF